MLNDNNVNVLIVDDLPDNLLALEAVIRLEGRTIFQASSGEEALALLLSHEFALAILDVQMPGMNGFELAELMRGTEKTRHIPIVFVTAAGKESNFAFKGYESGAVDFLYKPLDVQAVQSKVNVFALMYRQRLETRRQVLALEKSRQEQEALLANLQTTQMALEKALKLRDEFMSVVAHELRTPLNTLFMDVQMRKMLLDRGKIAVFDAAYLEKMVTRDQRQVQSMVRLIDDMLDVTRIRSNHLSIRPALFDLQAMLGRVVGNLNLQAQAAGSAITLHADQPVTGCWDEFRIEQVVTNLLTNALRYGNGKPVEVSVVLLGGSVAIQVRDQGKGIPVQDQQRIFDPFERAVGQDDSTSGLGLGLYITRQLVQAHGGTINVKSQEGEGSLFSVMLPLTVPATARP
ncbi:MULTISPECIES: hybrid sensor histidine kinase/response regulator [unclassified Polaromonas]|uniref:hybrid sensor histidine kinase/response regulator n=1 Tax=unclassified Polaromonas TaxID=2638319 RepID=UPI0018C9D2B6|nr:MULTISPECIES: hybrid sensor histidine kinase/response regulator [unclassified Polaromonas]MBG6073573.1 signal transduction histidine kinase [Polaromonas sp. CG_9.7]MBG6115575.1 signal transduction histidine kinase [Polaromonas sp. CG_9.2]MDH6185888.1 signal transduction histidine kinase [Polaromonas sp. CG_23.6]